MSQVPGVTILLGWPLRTTRPKNALQQFQLAFDDGQGSHPDLTWEPVLEWDFQDILPTQVISPLHQHLLLKKRVSLLPGIVFSATGPAMPFLQYAAEAAEQCFFNLPRPTLEKLAADKGGKGSRATWYTLLLLFSGRLSPSPPTSSGTSWPCVAPPMQRVH